MIAFINLSVFFFLFQSSFSAPQNAKNKLIVVSFDGVRFDFISEDLTPNLKKLLKTSTSAKVVVNVFPTQTFPNHFSIATGLYTENHGVLQSEIFDAKINKTLKYGYDLWHYNESVLPLWALNEKLGGVSGVSMWPGSDFKYGGNNPTYVLRYNRSIAFNQRVDHAISWLNNKTKPADLVFLYFEEPDRHEHPFGPNAPQTIEQIKHVDRIAKYLLETLKNNNLNDVNIIFLSDHGMEGVTRNNIINLEDFVGKNATMFGSSPVLQVYPKKGMEEQVFKILDQKAKQLKTFKVYKKQDIPERFHYKNCTRSPPILALAEPKYAFQDLYASIDWYMSYYQNVSKEGPFGVHGYDPETVNMHPYFIGVGPAFKQDFQAPKLYTVDMFLLFSRILNLDLSQVYFDGKIERIDGILKEGFNLRRLGLVLTIATIIPPVLGIIIICIIFLKRKFTKSVPEYIKVNYEDDLNNLDDDVEV